MADCLRLWLSTDKVFQSISGTVDPLLRYWVTTTNKQKRLLHKILIPDVCHIVSEYLSCKEGPCACFLDLAREQVTKRINPMWGRPGLSAAFENSRLDLVFKCGQTSCPFAFGFALSPFVEIDELKWPTLIEMLRKHQEKNSIYFGLAAKKLVSPSPVLYNIGTLLKYWEDFKHVLPFQQWQESSILTFFMARRSIMLFTRESANRSHQVLTQCFQSRVLTQQQKNLMFKECLGMCPNDKRARKLLLKFEVSSV